MLEIDRAKKIDETLEKLSEAKLRKSFEKIKHELIGVKNWRHELYENNRCELFPERNKNCLKNYIRFGGFTDKQVELVVSLISEVSNDKLYTKLVLIPEALSLLIQNMFDLGDDVNTYLVDGGIEFSHRRSDQWLSNWLSKDIIGSFLLSILFIFQFIYLCFLNFSLLCNKVS